MNMYPMTILSGNIRFMRMLAVILELYVNFPLDLRMPELIYIVWYASSRGQDFVFLVVRLYHLDELFLELDQCVWSLLVGR